LKNFIQKGGDAFLTTTDIFGVNLIDLIFKIIEKIYFIAANGEDETDKNAVTTLLVTLLENFKGKIDVYVPQIINVCL
jgi:hypothetical protein